MKTKVSFLIILCFAIQTLNSQSISKIVYKIAIDSSFQENIVKNQKDEISRVRVKEQYRNMMSSSFSLFFTNKESYFTMDNSNDKKSMIIAQQTFDLQSFYINIIESKFLLISGSSDVYNILYPKEYYKWDILSGQSKVIGNKICKLAKVKKGKAELLVWFCPDLPIPAGPGKYFGLPGLILEVTNPGKYSIYASKISLNDTAIKSIPKYPKGKEIFYDKLDKNSNIIKQK